ncbi:MAG: S8 family serine peptidase [Acidobacteriota bacterium]|nr:S8 family serine peptidase [Acidobacteriota bacterium]
MPVLLVLGLLATPVIAADRYLVATRKASRNVELRMVRESSEFRAHAIRAFEVVDAFAADLTSDEVAALKRSPEVRFVAPTVERHLLSDVPPLHVSQNGSAYRATQTLPDGIRLIHATELWQYTKGGGPINVVTFDTGIDTKHPDLAANYAGGYNTFTLTDDPTDDNGHGTHVAGTIAAIDNNFGVVGVAPEARIWSVKVLDRTGFGMDENLVAAAEWVIGKKRAMGGDWIVNCSLGASLNSPIEEEAFKRVIAEGILVVAATGNRGIAEVEFPAGYDGVLAVGAVDSNLSLASFSDHGPRMGVVAPGVRVLSTARAGSIAAAGVTLDNGPTFPAAALVGSSRGEFVAPFVGCGLGNPEDFPASVRGSIALVKRGSITFNQKVRNAEAAGAVAVVIYNYNDTDNLKFWTLLRPDCQNIEGCDDPTHPWPVVLGVNAADGARLLADPTRKINMGAWLDDYTIASGTSMAAPHVSGALTLIWSLAPNVNAERLRDVLRSTAVDLGTPGFDELYGYGMIDAFAAAMRIAPAIFHETREKRPPSEPRRSP